MLAKPQFDLRRRVEFVAFHNETSQFGLAVNAGYGFGRQADRNNADHRADGRRRRARA